MFTFLKKIIPLIILTIIFAGCRLNKEKNPPPSPAVTPAVTVTPSTYPVPSPSPKTSPLPNSPSPAPQTTTPSAKPSSPAPKASVALTPPPSAATPKLSEVRKDWYYIKKPNNAVPSIDEEARNWLPKYNAYYAANTSQKIMYLTFDEGYENGFTGSILDTLKKHNVKAAFFATKPYISGNPELVKRMVKEGHIVLNHTVTHRAMNLLSESELTSELSGVYQEFKRLTGTDMPAYVRPPEGAYSEKSLYLTKKLGYRTIFWSMAYKDWDTNAQPTREQTMSFIKSSHHNGAILLLHAVSKTNTECLDEILTYLKSQGYSFGAITNIQ